MSDSKEVLERPFDPASIPVDSKTLISNTDMKSNVIAINGTTLEGGGQLLRLSLALSSLLHVPIRITDIRGKRPGSRSKAGQGGGMKASHLAGAKWLEMVTSARVEGMELKSKDLTFIPNRFSSNQASPLTSTSSIWQDVKSVHDSWNNIYDGTTLIRRESKIAITSPGSIFLILQAVLPWILFAPIGSSSVTAGTIVPIRLTIVGGTNVSHSPSYEYMEQVLIPMFHEKVGLEKLNMKCTKKGWSHGSSNVGEVVFDIVPVSHNEQLPAFSFTSRGDITKFYVSILAPNLIMRKGTRASVEKHLLHHFPGIDVEFPVDQGSGHDKRLYLLIVAETSNGFKLGRDWLYDERINKDDPSKSVERLVKKVVNDIRAELAHGGCVDEYLQDQLVIFQTLCHGRSKVEGGSPSLHTKTARWVAEQLAGVSFDEEGHCDGISLVARDESKPVQMGNRITELSKVVKPGGAPAE